MGKKKGQRATKQVISLTELAGGELLGGGTVGVAAWDPELAALPTAPMAQGGGGGGGGGSGGMGGGVSQRSPWFERGDERGRHYAGAVGADGGAVGVRGAPRDWADDEPE
eukprot:ctg_2417.g438